MNTNLAPEPPPAPGNTTPLPATARVYEPGSEIFAQCYLARAFWPDTDPREVAQPTAVLGPRELDILRSAARNIPLRLETFLAARRAQSPAVLIHALLNHDAHQFQAKEPFRAEPLWLERIQAAVEANRPIEIVYPLFTKEGCAAKVFDASGPTGAERVTLLFFQHFAELAATIHPPGLVIHVLCDALLYNSAYRNSPVEAAAYLRELQTWVREIGAESAIQIHDYADLLGPFRTGFQAVYHETHRRLRNDPLSLVPAEEYDRLLKSIRANINTRPLGFDYATLKAVFGPNQNPEHPAWQETLALARLALHEKLAVKEAAYATNAVAHLFPRAVRATVHKGLKQGRAVLGLRTYPEYYRSSRILPYHGVALLEPEGGNWKATVHPEVSLRGRSDLTRIVAGAGTTAFYLAAAKPDSGGRFSVGR